MVLSFTQSMHILQCFASEAWTEWCVWPARAEAYSSPARLFRDMICYGPVNDKQVESLSWGRCHVWWGSRGEVITLPSSHYTKPEPTLLMMVQ